MRSSPLLCIVDDATDYRFLLQQLFNHWLPAYSVHFFSSGIEFLDELPHINPQPSLIILDRHMPDMNGYQTLLQLKQNQSYQTIPVVMMSNEADASEIYGCYEAGANSFLSKPIGLEALQKTMTQVCDYWLNLNQDPVQRVD